MRTATIYFKGSVLLALCLITNRWWEWYSGWHPKLTRSDDRHDEGFKRG